MILEKEITIPAKTEKKEYFVSPCVKCGKDDIKVEEYEDKYGFISTATCKSCKTEFKENTGLQGVIRIWNNNNHIPTMIEHRALLINKLKQEIRDLRIKGKKKTKTTS